MDRYECKIFLLKVPIDLSWVGFLQKGGSHMTPEEKKILLREIPKYIRENCYYTDGSLRCDDLWLVGWVAAEFEDRKNAMKVLINNEYGLLGNLLNKLARCPDESITRYMERADQDVLTQALREGGSRVIAKNELAADPYAMRLLIAHDKNNCKYLDSNLLNSKAFLITVVGGCPELLDKVNPNLFKDEAFVYSLIKKSHYCLRHLPMRFYSQYDLCCEAAKQEGYSLMYFDVDIRERDEIVLMAVSNRGNALSMASERQRKNRAIVETAVRNCGLALEYADDSLRNDKDLVLLAVAKHGMALRSASSELQDDDEVVMTAIEEDGYAIKFASERLRDCECMALPAVSSFPDAYQYLSERLQQNQMIKEIYRSKKEEEKSWLPSKKQ